MEYLPTESEKQEYLAYKSAENFFENLEGGLKSLDILKERREQSSLILICGAMAAFDRGIFHFLNEWSKREQRLFLVSEVTAQYRRYTGDKIEFPYICTPHLLAKEMIVPHMVIELTLEMKKLCRKKSYIQEAVENLEKRHPELGEGYAKAWSYYAYQYIQKLLDILMPEKVILWNEFYAFHHIFHGICRERKIHLEFMEFGCIPGTIVIEEAGQQGESLVARKGRKFQRRKISIQEESDAEKLLAFLKKTGLNRNIQPKQYFQQKMLNFYQAGRPMITYMGQNDYESGLVPYTKNTKKFHSPIFKNTLEAMEYLMGLSIQNNWNLVYKPHPIMNSLGQSGNFEESEEWSITVIKEIDINSLIDVSDVVVTILSQSAYISMIREKPVVMLGYTQLRNKGCTYEAFQRWKVKQRIEEALKYGFTGEQKQNFRKHVAQLLKYYLYDDMTERKMRFGMEIQRI